MKSILVKDKDPRDILELQQSLEKSLGKLEFKVSSKSKEVTESVIKLKPDLVLLGAILTDVDVIQTINILKENILTRNIPIIIIKDGETDNNLLQELLESGADAFISKPIDIVELTAQIKSLIKLSKSEEKLKNKEIILENTINKSTSENYESNNRYYELANLLPQIIYEHDMEGKLTFFNKQAYKSLGYTKKEFEDNFNAFDVFLPSEKSIIIDNIKKITEGKKPVNKTYNLLRKDGSTIPVLIYSSVIYKDHKAVGIRGVVVDISSQKKHQEKLKKSESRLQTLNSNIAELILLDNPNSIYKYTTATLSHYMDNTLVLCVSISEDEKHARLETIEGIKDNTLKSIINLSGFKPLGKEFKITELHKSHFKTGNLVKFQGGLKEFSANQYPQKAIELIQKLFNINGIYTIGINKDDKLLAAIHFLSFNNQEIEDRDYIESFVKQVGLVLQTKLAEQTLKESEERFRSLYNDSVMGLYRTTPAGEILIANPTLISLLEYDSFEDLASRDLSKTGYLDSRNRKLFKKLMEKDGEVRNFETVWITKTGNPIYINESAKLIRDPKGKALYYDGSIQNITKQKITETALKESESKFQELFNKSSDAILLLKNGKIIDCNESFLNTFLFKNKKEAIGKHPGEISPERQSDGQLSSVKAESLIKDAIKNRSSRFEWDHQKINGDIFPMEVILTTIKAEKNNEVIHAVMRDITQRRIADFNLKESILNFRLIFENSPLGIYLANTDGEIIDANKALIDILGSPSIIETRKINVLKFPPLVSNGYAEKFKECYTTGNTIELEMDYLSKWGKTMSLHSFLIPLKDPKGIINKVYTLVEDITERKRTEIALRESEKRFTAFMNNLPAGIFIKDSEGNYLFSNKYNEEVHGLKNWKGKNVYDFFSKEIADKFTESDQKVLEGENLYLDGKIINAEGELVYFKNRQFAIKQDDGSKLIGGISLDITNEKKAELELKESEDLYRTMIETSNDIIWMLDTEGNFTFINDLATLTIGLPKEDYIGKPFNLLLLPEEENYILNIYKRLIQGETVNYEVRIKNNKSEIITLQTNSTPIYKNDKYSGVISFAKDVTKQKKQDLIRQIIFNISTAAITSDNLPQLTHLIKKELGKIIDTSNFYLTIKNKSNNSLSFPFFVDDYDNPKSFPDNKTLAHYIIQIKKPLLLYEKDQIELENKNLIDNYGTRPKIWLGVPLKFNNEVIGVITVQSYKNEQAYNKEDQEVLEFISGQISMAIYRKQAEENLKNALTKAEESDRLKSAFLANMSHEIRTPMNGILGFSQLIKDSSLSQKDHDKYVEIIEKSGERLLNIINDLVDISKIEAGQMDVSISQCDIHEQLSFLYTFFKPEAEIKGLELNLNKKVNKEKINILTDREKLYAIFTNLIKNAVKYSRKGKIEFGYDVVEATKNNLGSLSFIGSNAVRPKKVIKFYVKDNGIGIPKNRLSAIFDRFVQADIEDSKVFEGAGLGLSITKAYVEMLGGKIWVKSEINKGSVFYFTLPFLQEKETVETFQNTEINKQQEGSKQKKILIAEDEKISYDYISIVLKKTKSILFHALNGKEAIQIMQENPDIDLILMDIKMPILGGYEATQQIRKFNKDVIIIAQTAYALAGDAENALKYGCNDYISKPINSDELLGLIDKYL